MTTTDIRQKYYQSFMQHPDITNYQDWCRQIWFHPAGKEIRLSSLGLALFREAQTMHTVRLSEKDRRKAKHYIFLSKYCKEPYYIDPEKVVFCDEHEAMVFKLCDGDFDNVNEISK